MSKLLINTIVILSIALCFGQKKTNTTNIKSSILYTMPDESEPHEGTWLQWPHEYQYGEVFSNQLQSTWIAIAKALADSENVHIIAYDNFEQEAIIDLLEEANVPMTNIDFKIYPTDDFWARDNGPIYVRDKTGALLIEDWGFNAWGGKAKYKNCNAIPERIAASNNIKLVDLNAIMINEGGAIEIDGNGTLMATKSAILNSNRNPGMSQQKAESIFTKYLGATHFVWLNGVAGHEITDMHIDGFARFANHNTLVTMNQDDLLDWEVPLSDIKTLYTAKNKANKLYTIVKLPLTQNNVSTEYGKKLDYKGSYINYYIGNSVVLVPNYNDKNDKVANSIIQRLYPTRTVIGIDVRNLYKNGGMIHCVTQQQPR
jgi:agmatine deiminase